MQSHNFCAGPAALPPQVYAQAAAAITNFNNTGVSILSISHRSEAFKAILYEALNTARELLQLPSADFELLLLPGGASQQFAMVPLNLLHPQGQAAYLVSGHWAKLAALEAQRIRPNCQIIDSAEAQQYRCLPQLPQNFNDKQQYTYLHLTTNNTIYGTQWATLPLVNCPIVADASSDLLAAPLQNIERLGFIYACVQKNIGAAGVTLVAIRKEFLQQSQKSGTQTNQQLPNIFNYQAHIKAKSLYSTPPVFSVYCTYLMLQWVKQQGLEQLARHNQLKAQTFYTELDENPLFEGHAHPQHRSKMNAVFTCKNPDLIPVFAQFAAQNQITGIDGHRTIGGFRISFYNAIPLKSVQYLTEIMQAFTQKYG